MLNILTSMGSIGSICRIYLLASVVYVEVVVPRVITVKDKLLSSEIALLIKV